MTSLDPSFLSATDEQSEFEPDVVGPIGTDDGPTTDPMDAIGGTSAERTEQFEIALKAMLWSLRRKRMLLERTHPLSRSGFEQAVRAAMGQNAQAAQTSLFDGQAFEQLLNEIAVHSRLAHTYENAQKEHAYDNERLEAQENILAHKIDKLSDTHAEFSSLLENDMAYMALSIFDRYSDTIARLSMENKILQEAYTTYQKGYQNELYRLGGDEDWKKGWNRITGNNNDDTAPSKSTKNAIVEYLFMPIYQPVRLLDFNVSEAIPAPDKSQRAFNDMDFLDKTAKDFLLGSSKAPTTFPKKRSPSLQSTASQLPPTRQQEELQKRKRSINATLFAEPTKRPSFLFDFQTTNDGSLVIPEETAEDPDLLEKLKRLETANAIDDDTKYSQTALSFRYQWASAILLFVPAYLGTFLLEQLRVEGDVSGFNDNIRDAYNIVMDTLREKTKASDAKSVKQSIDNRLTSIITSNDLRAFLDNKYVESLNAMITNRRNYDAALAAPKEIAFNAYVRAHSDQAKRYYDIWYKLVDDLWTMPNSILKYPRQDVVRKIATVITGLELYAGFYVSTIQGYNNDIGALQKSLLDVRNRIDAYDFQLTDTASTQNTVATQVKKEVASMIAQATEDNSVHVGPALQHAMQTVFASIQQAFRQYRQLPGPNALALSNENTVRSAFAESVAATMARSRARTGQFGYLTNDRYAALSNDVARTAASLASYHPAGPIGNKLGGWRFKRRGSIV